MRPRARLMALGVSAWIVAGSTASVRPEGESWSEACRSALSGAQAPDASVLAIFVHDVLLGLGFIAAALVAGAALVATAAGRLGWVSHGQRARLGRVQRERPGFRQVLLGLLVALAIGIVLLDVLAGAARAPAASQVGLGVLWQTWVVRTFAYGGTVLVGVGVLELVLERRARDRALFQSVQEAREERLAHGGRRR